MILLLSGGGGEARELSALLEQKEIPTLCLFQSFADAGAYGRGNAVVGRLDSREMEKLFKREAVAGVVDAASEGTAQSLAAMEACRACRIPYVKYLRLAAEDGPLVRAAGSYRIAAREVNHCSGPALFYAKPETVRTIAERAAEPSRLYTPIPRGISFDVTLAMEFGLPLVNVLEMDGIHGADAVCRAIDRIGAKALVCDGSMGIVDKLEAAARREILTIVTHSMGIEYTRTALCGQEVLDCIQGWLSGGGGA